MRGIIKRYPSLKNKVSTQIKVSPLMGALLKYPNYVSTKICAEFNISL